MNARRFAWIAVSTLLAVRVAVSAPAADWPAYRADAARSGATSEQLEFPLAPVWVYQPAQAPSPAWPEPGREMHRIDFDYAFQPVAAGGLVYFGSSADDTVRALDAATGETKWSFTTGGPVRFAPHIAAGNCYVASDDGFAYCLNAATGKLVWKFRAAPGGRQVVGNSRMISRRPCRSGVTVLDGAAYVVAGMWPAEGVYVYALDAGTGEEIWCNDTSGSMFIAYPHPGSYSIGGVTPQGYMAVSKDAIVVPTGRSVPAVFDRRTGRLLHYQPGYDNKHNGGCWASVAGEMYLNSAHIWHGDRSIAIGESAPQQGDGIMARSLETSEVLWRLDAKHKGVLIAQTLYAAGGGAVEAIDNVESENRKTKWSAEHPRAYCVAVAGNAVLVGGAGTITAFSTADGERVWRREVDGQVRGIAVAGGRLIAATNRGAVYCFEQRGLEMKPVELWPKPPTPPVGAKAPRAAADVLELIKRADIDKGFALVLGGDDARLAEAIARRTQLGVIAALLDESKVTTERRRLLDAGNIYGSRVAVQHLDDLARLPYARYFANVVVVAPGAEGVPGEELYRVLRPCGGIMCLAGVSSADTKKLIRQAAVRQAELRPAGDSYMLVRGKLPGAFDWDSKVISDERLKAPLELLWFGGPGPDRMVARHWQASTPIPANGRYFAIGEYHLIAVDAYNGTELWSRELGKLLANRTPIAADDDSVYLNFNNPEIQPDGRIAEEPELLCLELDAGTGEPKKLYGRPRSSQRFPLGKAQTFELKVDEQHSGTVTLGQTDTALEVTLATKDPDVTPGDSWELYFDFRPRGERFAFYGPGAFAMTIVPSPGPAVGEPSWWARPGIARPEPKVTRKDAPDGTCVVLEFAWKDLREVIGGKPRDFTFAVTLNSSRGGQETTVRVHKFADAGTGMINNGWGMFVVEPPAAALPGLKAAGVPIGKLDDLPDYARGWGRLPPTSYDERWHFPTYASRCGGLPAEQDENWRTAQLAALVTRTEPLTGKTSVRMYRRAYGCGGVISSAGMDFFRSGTVGYYDLADDSGLRNFGGVRPGCGMTMAPALGLLISSEGAASCTCSYNYHTSVALVPAAERGNEDWAVFYDRPENALIQRAALNLGAPGDRADGETLWLGVPRPQANMGVASQQRVDLKVPLNLAFRRGFGPYRLNADHVAVAGTDKPWIYASGLRGLQRATLDMEYLADAVLSLPIDQPPKIDGAPGDACWTDDKTIHLAGAGASVLLRHDADNLYLAYKRPAEIDRRGVSTPWKAAVEEDDAAVWDDDSFELYLSNIYGDKCVHLGVSASGARYDAFWEHSDPFPAFDVPRLEGIAIDGKTDDWGDRGFHVRSVVSLEGKMCAPEDFDPSFKLAWNDKGLLLLVQVRDDVVREHAKPGEMWRQDSIELFMAPAGASNDVLQIIMGTGARGPGVRTAFFTKGNLVSPGGPTADAAGAKTDDGYVVEALLPWKNIGATPADGTEIGFQMFNNDSDDTGERFQTAFHPLGHPFWNPSLHHLRLAAKPSEPVEFKRGEAPGEDGTFAAAEPYPFPLAITPLGRYGEDKKYNGQWTAAARADENAFTVELALPLKTLAAAGLKKDKLIINMGGRGTLQRPPALGQGYAPLLFSTGRKVPPRSFTVRLHFAEMHGAKAGERVFDVRLQDKTVLENFDVVKEAGGGNRAISKEFNGVIATATMKLEMIPKAKELTDKTAPIISAIEVFAE